MKMQESSWTDLITLRSLKKRLICLRKPERFIETIALDQPRWIKSLAKILELGD